MSNTLDTHKKKKTQQELMMKAFNVDMIQIILKVASQMELELFPSDSRCGVRKNPKGLTREIKGTGKGD